MGVSGVTKVTGGHSGVLWGEKSLRGPQWGSVE